ncbi:CD15/CS22/SEF14 family fimbrial major subunit [Escherichia coli]
MNIKKIPYLSIIAASTILYSVTSSAVTVNRDYVTIPAQVTVTSPSSLSGTWTPTNLSAGKVGGGTKVGTLNVTGLSESQTGFVVSGTGSKTVNGMALYPFTKDDGSVAFNAKINAATYAGTTYTDNGITYVRKPNTAVDFVTEGSYTLPAGNYQTTLTIASFVD